MPVTFTIDTMIRLLRMTNIAMLFLYSFGLIIRVPQGIGRLSKAGSVPLIAFLVVTLLLFVLHGLSLYYAWRGLGSASTLQVVQIAWCLHSPGPVQPVSDRQFPAGEDRRSFF